MDWNENTKKIRIQSFPWNRAEFPSFDTDGEALGHVLFDLVAKKSYSSSLPLEIWMFVADSIQSAQFQHPWGFEDLVGLASMDGVSMMAVLGPFTKKDQSKLAQVYIETSDCRWWLGAQALTPEGHVCMFEPVVTSALRGDDKPLGMGGWFSLARKLSIRGTIHFPDMH